MICYANEFAESFRASTSTLKLRLSKLVDVTRSITVGLQCNRDQGNEVPKKTLFCVHNEPKFGNMKNFLWRYLSEAW